MYNGGWNIENQKEGKQVKTLIKSARKISKIPLSLRPLGITVKIPEQSECSVIDCFTHKKVSAYWSAVFYNLLLATMPASEKVSVRGYKLTKLTTEAELAKCSTLFTNLKQIENLILRTEKGENTGLDTNRGTNIFFLEVGKLVFTVNADRFFDGWSVNLHRFGPGSAWNGGSRCFAPAT